MLLEKQRNYRNANFRTGIGSSAFAADELVNPRFDKRMQTFLKRTELRTVGEHLGGDATPLRSIGNELVNNVVSVNRLDAKLVQATRGKRLAARYASGQGDFHLTNTSQVAAGLDSVAMPTPSPPTTKPATLTVYFFSFVLLPEVTSAYILNDPLNTPVFGV